MTVSLNSRQLEIMRWKADGKTTAEIGEILGLSRFTIDTYIERALKATDTLNMTALVATALRKGWIT